MTRQYIGARYVPKFFEYNGSNEWVSGYAYEALTIVTRNYASYISKIPVPANVGAPESNPEYWVLTGQYNAQIEAYRQEVVGLGTRVTTAEGDIDTLEGDIDALEGDVSDLDSRMTSAEGDIDTLEDGLSNTINDIRSLRSQTERKIVFLGDSYNTDLHYNWSKKIMSNMGLTEGTDAWTLGMPGGSFGGGTGYAYLEGLQTLRENMTADQANSVTDVVIQGGVNEYGNSDYAALQSAVRNCEDYVTTNFPNATLWIPLVGWGYSTGTMRTQLLTAYNYIKGACRKARILDKGYTVLTTPYMLEADMVHPKETAAYRIATVITNFICGGDMCLYDFPELSTSFNNNAITIHGRITPYGLHVYQKDYAGITPASPVDLINSPVTYITEATDLDHNQLFMRDAYVLGTAVIVRDEPNETFYNVNAIFRFHLESGNTPTWKIYMGLRSIVPGQTVFQCTGVKRIYPNFDAIIPIDAT